jgi:hypothetical protein
MQRGDLLLEPGLHGLDAFDLGPRRRQLGSQMLGFGLGALGSGLHLDEAAIHLVACDDGKLPPLRLQLLIELRILAAQPGMRLP